MRYVKYLILILIAAVAVILALANRGPVTLNLLPAELALPAPVDGIPTSVTLPIYIAMFGAVFFGVLIGLVLELFREGRHRRAERQYRREAERLDKENRRLAAKAGEEDEDILLGLKS